MNNTDSKDALIKRIRPALAHWGWHLVEARDDWFQDDQKVRAYYVTDDNGHVVEPYFDLNALARDLRVLGEWETVEGCDMPMVGAGRATEALELADGDVAEVAAIMAAIGEVNADVTQVSKGDPHRVELKDDQGRVWLSAQRVNKVRYAW